MPSEEVFNKQFINLDKVTMRRPSAAQTAISSALLAQQERDRVAADIVNTGIRERTGAASAIESQVFQDNNIGVADLIAEVGSVSGGFEDEPAPQGALAQANAQWDGMGGLTKIAVAFAGGYALKKLFKIK